MEALRRSVERAGRRGHAAAASQPAAPRAGRLARDVPRFVAPQLATLVDARAERRDWVFEIKYDGYRLEAVIAAVRCRCTLAAATTGRARFPELADAVRPVEVKTAVLDGEVVALDPSGRSAFSLLQQSLDAGAPQDLTYFVFDLLHLDGEDLRSLPLPERRKRLERVLPRAARARQRPDPPGPAPRGRRRRACCVPRASSASKGIIGKRNDAPYTSGRAARAG